MAVSRSDAAREYDAIVVGSGISGGWAAKELCEHGLRTLVLEAGPPIVPDARLRRARPALGAALPRAGATGTRSTGTNRSSELLGLRRVDAKFFVNDRENPYANDADKPFIWIRGRHVGGRSLMWGRQVYRWSDLDFEANAREGDRGRLADPLRRHRALVRPRRAVHRRERPGRRAGAAARRAVPPADGDELRRAGDAGGAVGAMEAASGS